tara:strand:- start:4042 stop:4536 length:495 start_codon:yes stop_codon:yes gene_type:complete
LDLLHLQNLSSELGELLINKNYSFTSAESCTGGWVGQVATSVPGSSRWYGVGFITYSNKAKIEILGVSKETLKDKGAVSQEVVEEMVGGAIERSQANLGVAISGVAGPGGGNKNTPVGTVCMAWKLNDTIYTSTELFNGNRSEVRYKTVEKAYKRAIYILEEKK